jgi:hypothetical protein
MDVLTEQQTDGGVPSVGLSEDQVLVVPLGAGQHPLAELGGLVSAQFDDERWEVRWLRLLLGSSYIRPAPRTRWRGTGPITTHSAPAAPPITRPYVLYPTGSSASCTAACATTLTATKPSPGTVVRGQPRRLLAGRGYDALTVSFCRPCNFGIAWTIDQAATVMLR